MMMIIKKAIVKSCMIMKFNENSIKFTNLKVAKDYIYVLLT